MSTVWIFCQVPHPLPLPLLRRWSLRTKTGHLLAYGFDGGFRVGARRVGDSRQQGRAQAVCSTSCPDYPLTWDDVLAQVGGHGSWAAPYLLTRWLPLVALLTVLTFNGCNIQGSPYYNATRTLDPWNSGLCVWCVS